MKPDRPIHAIIPEVLPPIDCDEYVQRDQYGNVLNRYSIVQVDGKTYRTQEQVVYRPPTEFGYWLQVVGAVAIGMVGLYLIVWAIGFLMKSDNSSSQSQAIEVIQNA